MRISTAFKGYRAVASSFGAETPRFPTSSVPCLFVSPTFLLSFPLPLATRWPTEICSSPSHLRGEDRTGERRIARPARTVPKHADLNCSAAHGANKPLPILLTSRYPVTQFFVVNADKHNERTKRMRNRNQQACGNHLQ